MNRNPLLIWSLTSLAAINASCSHELDGTVRPESPDSFLVYYHPWNRLIDEFGPGTENVRARLKAVNYVNDEKVWRDAIEEAIPKFLEAKSMTPSQCKAGVVVVNTGELEGGNGWARFRCK